jgi:hypothetical protein
MSFESEVESFWCFARSFPDTSIFLVDTDDTLECTRKAAAVAQEMREQGHGFRLPVKSRESHLQLHLDNGSRIIGLPAADGKARVYSPLRDSRWRCEVTLGHQDSGTTSGLH